MPGCQAGRSHHRVADRVAQTCERVGVRLPCLGNDSDVLGSALGIEDPEGDHAPLAYTGDRVGGILDVVRRGPVTFYFPLLTCVVLSVVLTIVVNLFWRR